MLTDSWFYQPELHQGPLLHGHHDHTLMLVSILIAIAASWLGLQVAGLARKASTTFTRQGALLSGAIALGGGIWAMHFIGMLAFTLPLEVDYDRGITLLSMVPAMAASLVACTCWHALSCKCETSSSAAFSWAQVSAPCIMSA
ncbi:MHYT domain-containing protein [Halopseudomonas pachastrellae]|nr:MHYT domain-containing protein [Halopseudomonas pachastrellae]